jgi:hypothetical protein
MLDQLANGTMTSDAYLDAVKARCSPQNRQS